jgi:hypothetical protein
MKQLLRHNGLNIVMSNNARSATKADCTKFDVNEKFHFSANGNNFRNNVQQQSAQKSFTQIMFRGEIGV